MNKCFGCYLDFEREGFHEACSKKIFHTSTPPKLETLSSELENHARIFIGNRHTVTGVQRKLSLHLDPKEDHRFTIIGAIGGNFILKPPSDEYEELPELEDVCMHLGSIAGLSVAPHCLIPMLDGKLAYITRRFDREKSKKYALEDACQLSGLLTEGKYRSSHERLAQVIQRYSSFVGDDLLRLFELTLFSFVTGNADMHLKNFSLLRNPKGHYRLSPAYDLVPTRLILSAKEDPEELALNLNGKKSRFKREDFIYYGQYMNIPEKVIDRTFERFVKKFPDMLTMIEKSFLSDEKKEEFTLLLKERYSRIT